MGVLHLNFLSIFIFTLFSCAYESIASELVPVCMWQTKAINGEFTAINHVSSQTFAEIVLAKQKQLESQRVIVFAEQNLSPEDFSAKHVFSELKDVASHTKISYLPTVSSPLESINAIARNIPSVPLHDVLNNTQFLLNDQLIVDLNDARDDEDRTQMLQRHVRSIVDVYKAFTSAKNEDVLAMLTAYHASWIVPNEITKKRHARSTADGNYFVSSTTHYLFYVNGTFTSKVNGTAKEFSVNGASEDAASKNLIWQTTNGNTITLNVDYSNTSAWWAIPYIIYDSYNFSSSFGAPTNFSFSCSSNGTLKISRQEVYLQFPTFQLQYFPDGIDPAMSQRFNDSYDCVGFTSAPIWSGVFVTFLLIIIMSFGLNMIMDIKTMDRFDDPKGKTIVINASE